MKQQAGKPPHEFYDLDFRFASFAACTASDFAYDSVDKKTEAKMVDIIRERFQDRTVICVAHNLNTIIDYDEVIVLEAGRIVEQGKPSILALEPSIFASLLHAADGEPEDASEEENTGADLSPTLSE